MNRAANDQVTLGSPTVEPVFPHNPLTAPYPRAVALDRVLRVMTKTFAELGFEGRLIAVEGLDGSGKSTQIYLLKRWLEMRGFKVFFSEWNSSALVKSDSSAS